MANDLTECRRGERFPGVIALRAIGCGLGF